LRFLLEAELGPSRWPREMEYDLQMDPALVAVPAGKEPWSAR
jgi:hypothetical protein